MRFKNVFIGVGLGAVGILIGWLVIENDKKSKLIKHLEIDNLKLIRESLNNNDSISSEIKSQLNELFNTYKNIDSNIAKEIATALTIIDAGEEEKGIGSLSIIIEDLLKLKYKKSTKFRNWLKIFKKKNINKAVQADYIEYAKEDNLLKKEEFDFANAVRSIRNGTYHDPGQELPWNYQKAGLLVGIELILRISKNLKNEKKNIQIA